MRWSFFIFCFLFLHFSACKEEEKDKLRIATAANMQFAIKEIVSEFDKKYGLKSEIILGSSGKLTAQIKEGAPYDIFLSANMKYPNELYNSNFSIDKPLIYAHGKLVIWSFSKQISSVQDIESIDFEKIAIANPKNAPYGIASLEFLKSFEFYEGIKSKLVYGESISQVNQFVFSKAADAGFTSKSVVLSTDLKHQGNWIEIDENKHSPIQQGIIILKNAKSKLELAKKFSDFIFSKEGKTILEKYGYSISKN